MTYRGHYDNGVIRPDEPVNLPEGTEVEFAPVQNGERDALPQSNARFWANCSIDDIVREQGVKPIQDISSLRIDWPEDEDMEDFLAFLREVRK